MALVSPPTANDIFETEAVDALTIMCDGCLFLTISPKPHFQLMFLSEDSQRLQWYTHIGGELDKLNSLLLKEIVDVKYLDVIFLIKHKKGLLKLGATNSEDLYYWFIGLKTLLQPNFNGTEVLVDPPHEKLSFIPRLTELYGKIEEKSEAESVKGKKQRKQRQNPVRKTTAPVSVIPFVAPKVSRPESTPPVDLLKPRPKSDAPKRPASFAPKSGRLSLNISGDVALCGRSRPPPPSQPNQRQPPLPQPNQRPPPPSRRNQRPPPPSRPNQRPPASIPCIPSGGGRKMWVRKNGTQKK